MTKTFYVQIEKDTNKITDVIEYAHEGYAETLQETPLPPRILEGCYKLVSGSVVYVGEWDKGEKVTALEMDLTNTKLAMAEIIEQQQVDNLNNQLALAELIESIMEGGTVA